MAVRKLLRPTSRLERRKTKPAGEAASWSAGPSLRSFPGFLQGKSPGDTPRSPGGRLSHEYLRG